MARCAIPRRFCRKRERMRRPDGEENRRMEAGPKTRERAHRDDRCAFGMRHKVRRAGPREFWLEEGAAVCYNIL